MKILDGKALANTIKEELAVAVEKRTQAGKHKPHLVAVLVGSDGASETYVGHKVRACERIGFQSTLIRKDDSISQEELLQVIDDLNKDASVDGYIVQLPLPKHIDSNIILRAIDPIKDVDGFHPQNVGQMTLGLPAFVSATPKGIVTLLERYGVETSGKHCVVIGRSNIVGRPVSILLSGNRTAGNATVTLCHSRTQNLKALTLQADILVVALGRPGFITADMVKEGVVVIDVGITRVEDKSRKRGYRLSGDVDFESVSQKASFITPVPGGVGPMTVVSLLENTLQAAEQRDR